MKPNIGTLDRGIRVIVGIVLISLWPLGLIQGTAVIIAFAVGIAVLATALLRWCPPYDLLGINTGAHKDQS
jgi:hypothetical protein